MKKFFKRLFRVEKTVDAKEVFLGDEIYLKKLLLLFWERRKVLYFMLFLFLLLGILALGIENDLYTSNTTFLSEVAGSGTGAKKGSAQLRGLASLAGVSLEGGTSSADLESPDFYPSILSNPVFLAGLLEEKVYIKRLKSEVKLIDYFLNYKIESGARVLFTEVKRLPKTIIGGITSLFSKSKKKKRPEFIRSDDRGYLQPRYNKKYRGDEEVMYISPNQEAAFKSFEQAIALRVDGRFLRLSVTTTDRELSAFISKVLMNKLVEYVKNYRTQKERMDLKFMKARTKKAKKAYTDAQNQLASFRDANIGASSARIVARRQELETEYRIAERIYQEYAAKLENSKVILAENTPVYSVFSPTSIPVQKDKPAFVFTLVQFLFIGFALSFIIISIQLVRAILT